MAISESSKGLLILAVSSIGLLLLIVAVAGTSWATVRVYSTGIFLGCIRAYVYFCTAEFVFPLSLIFAYALDTTWFYVVRMLLLLSIIGTLTGIVCSFDRKNDTMIMVTALSFLTSGSFILVSCVIYWNYTAIIASFIGNDFYIAVLAGLAITGCGLPFAAQVIRRKFGEEDYGREHPSFME
ncbi:hypothetical protein RF11_02178 [Thelohanellus kitauei]|uniref:Uncharacterized protein n=1 Tax=Thelohanellus kitauei TaxID=669202 RepID=A0A0C2MXW5_THEKT|nr:hypothetical protein RF11_02178 [Thelohanellus kitauei]